MKTHLMIFLNDDENKPQRYLYACRGTVKMDLSTR